MESAHLVGADRLSRLMARGTEFLGSRYAILGGAMTWVSDNNLVAAISEAGGFGVIASGGMPINMLKDEIRKTREKTSNPFGVNLITLRPDLMDLIEACGEMKVSHIVLAGGLPPAPAIARIKEFGAKLMVFAPTAALARKLVRSGADAIIVEGSEAGGHIGPVSTSVLVQEILPVVESVPVFVAGGIGRGDLISAYLEMGAAGAQLGTRFVVAHESIAHENFKKAFIRANARDAIASVQIDPRFPVIPVRALKNKATEAFMAYQQETITAHQAGDLDLDAAQLQIEHFWGGALKAAVIDGDVDNGSLMAGQSVGMVKSVQSTAEIIDELVAQAAAALRRRSGPGAE